MASNDVFVIGVGLTKFERPGARADVDYPDMVHEAVSMALADAGLSYNDIQQAYVGYVYGDSTCGQRALYQLGMSTVPIVNVHNNCATGSTALYLAHEAVAGGRAHCVLAVGFEKMQRGSLKAQFEDRCNPLDRHVEVMCANFELEASPIVAQMFGNAAREHMNQFGTGAHHLAKIAHKNHRHSVDNPWAQSQRAYTQAEISDSATVHWPLTRLQCCGASNGAAAALLVSRHFLLSGATAAGGATAAVSEQTRRRAVQLLGVQLVTDPAASLSTNTCRNMVGYAMSQLAVSRLLAATGVSLSDVQVVELHDCFSANELLSYEALGLCEEGGAGRFVDSDDNTYGGRFVVNPSGGLIAKGHPLGATGLAQCAELCWQVRGEAGNRQVVGARFGLQHNIGLGGAAVVALYRLFNQHNHFRPPSINSTNRKDGSGLVSTALLLRARDTNLIDQLSLNDQRAFVVELRVTVGDAAAEMMRWTLLRRDNNTSALLPNSHVCADLCVTVSDAVLCRLLTARLCVRDAVQQRLVGHWGDATQLVIIEQLAELLNAATSRL